MRVEFMSKTAFLYERKSNELLKLKGYYVAILDGEIVDKDRDFFKLLQKLRKKKAKIENMVIDYIPEEQVKLII